MLEKAAASAADEVLFDLEDACAPSEKEAARAHAVAALRTHPFGAKLRAVRVNDVTTPWCHGDVGAVAAAGEHLDAIILPKVEDASHVHFVHHLLNGIERAAGAERRIALELLIESPRGLTNLREIVRASDRIAALIFGSGDYAASLGIPQDEIGMIEDRYPGHQWHWAMSEVVAHARSIGAQAIDGAHADYTDEAYFRRSALCAKLLGYDGKWCIHPNQIPWANDTFSPSADELVAAQRVLAVYEEAVREGRGAISLDGKLVDEASRKLAEATVMRSRSLERS